MSKIKFTAKLAIGAVTTATAAALVLAMGPAANADPISPGGRVHTHTGAHGGHAAQDLSWTTPATHTRHAKIKNQTTTDSASSVITINDPSAPTSYDFNVNLPAGTQLQPNDTGGVDVIQPTENGVAITVGQFGAPWAKDNNGKTLKTSYKVSGNTITQTVDTNTAQYPITADPKFTWGWVSGTVYFNKSETKTMANSVGDTVAVCAASALLHNAVMAACMVGAIQIDIQARTAASRGQCVKFKVIAGPPPGLAFAGAHIYSGGYCK